MFPTKAADLTPNELEVSLRLEERYRTTHLQPLRSVELVWADDGSDLIVQHFSRCARQAAQPSIFESGQIPPQRPTQSLGAFGDL
jgi:hypothetical protein